MTVDDDMDDSDAEHAWLREKRMRKPARLWRSARERAVWLRMARAAETAQDASYCAYILCDRWVLGRRNQVAPASAVAQWRLHEVSVKMCRSWAGARSQADVHERGEQVASSCCARLR